MSEIGDFDGPYGLWNVVTMIETKSVQLWRGGLVQNGSTYPLWSLQVCILEMKTYPRGSLQVRAAGPYFGP